MGSAKRCGSKPGDRSNRPRVIVPDSPPIATAVINAAKRFSLLTIRARFGLPAPLSPYDTATHVLPVFSIMRRLPATLIVATLLISGCATSVRTPFEPSAAEFARAASVSGALAAAEAAVAKRSDAETEVPETQQSARAISGFSLLDRSEEALRWRLALIDSATQTIDTQYYLYHPDSTGMLLTSRLLEAADRGVRVRLIIDDMATLSFGAREERIKETMGALLTAHPNIQLRLFNSATNRKSLGWGWDFATNFSQLNHRMHNKSLIVDNRAVVLGGRNIGDEYMGLSDHFNFRDIDVLGVGPIARQSSEVFDIFWNSGWVFPLHPDMQSSAELLLKEQRAELQRNLRSSEKLERFSLTAQNWEQQLQALVPSLHLGTSEVLTDKPTTDGISHDLFDWLMETLPNAQQELLVTNAYLIPEERGIALLTELDAKGVDVLIHTNSLASQDVPAVNSHYKAWRVPLLETGAGLYELRADAQIKATVVDTRPVTAKFIGLHAKSLVVDRRYAVIGSANFDPRSAFINSEMVAVIDSTTLANELAAVIERDANPANSWRVNIDEGGGLYWQNGDETVTRQPSLNAWQRLQDLFFMLFPKNLY